MDHRSLRKVDLAALRPRKSDIAPAVDWGDSVPTAEDIYETQRATVAAATISSLRELVSVEPAMTRSVVDAAPADCRLHGLEFRMKSPRSLAQKIDTRSRRQVPQRPADVAMTLTDLVRYTVVAPEADDVVRSARSTLSTLERDGWTVTELEHSYVDGNPYKGLHAIVRHESGQDVEIQFHAESGIAVKDAHHADYEVMRDAQQSTDVRGEAFERMSAAWGGVAAPDGLADLEIGGVIVMEKIYPNRYRRTKMNSEELR